MPSYEFSYIANAPSYQGDSHLLNLVEEHNRQQGHLTALPTPMGWSDAWQQLMRVAIYKKGPSLSEIGAPWTSDFVGMNSLRPFQPVETERVGGAQAYAGEPWRNVHASGGSQVWGIPARVDARVIFFWTDMLEKAGLDPATAFSSTEQFEESLARLQAAGFERPLAWVADGSRNTVYHAASWIWAAGGDIIDPQGKLAFHRPEAQIGLVNYFKLHRYLAQHEGHPNTHFLTRKAAVTYYNMNVYNGFKSGEYRPYTPESAALLGAALPPGPAFVGGTNLVVWQHVSHQVSQSALELIAALVTSPAFTNFCLETGYLPARRDALNMLRQQADACMRVMVQAVDSGRTSSSAHLWVLVAERLGAALGGIWNALRQDPNQDVADLVSRMTHMAAARLEQSLS